VTRAPAPQPIPTRIGGFGGADGLASFLRAERIGALIDATHPFAARMSANAVAAAGLAGTRLLAFSRAPWPPEPGDLWREVDTMEEAAAALAGPRRTVFLTQGRLQLAVFAAQPQHRYVVRAIDRPAEIDALPDHRLILARGPFLFDDELSLMRSEEIRALVTKNSGGGATYPKIAAARALGIEVVIVRRPAPSGAATVYALEEAMAWIRAQRDPP